VDAQTQSLNPTDYTWTIRDGNSVVSSSSTGTTPSFNFNFTNTTQSNKDFSVQLTTTLPSSCFGDSIRTIRIEPVPTSQFTVDTLQFDCQLMKINLNATQKGLTSYHWLITENGTVVSDVTGADDQFQFTFNRTAVDNTVQFSLDTKNFANCTSPVTTSTMTIPMLDNMNVSFTASPASQSLPSSTVTITNATNTGPWTYLWDFGDGSTSTDPSISNHTYSVYGQYTIMLTVTSNVCIQTQTQQVTILAIPPVVDFAYAPASGCAPLTVQFTNLTQFADPSTYHWDFGDGGTSQAANPSYTYFNAGTYSVSLSASNITGQTITNAKQSIIEVFVKPVANFKVTPPLIYVPGGILYTSNLSTNATGFYWDFGDGQTSTDFRPEHTYKKDGSFTITLAASNESGCTDTLRIVEAVIVKKGNEVLVPNAFSPGTNGAGGGDGHNDVFLPIMRGVVQFEMLIFNRWGQLLFESRDQSTGWDGYYHGKLCEQDVYMYKLTVKLENGENVVRMGDVNLIR
jgi:gliding motility-associated-like protein